MDSSMNICKAGNFGVRLAFSLILLSATFRIAAQGEDVGRICVVTPEVEMGSQSLAIAPSLQSTFVQFLLRPNLSAVSLAGRSADQLQAEALRERCDFLLYSQIILGKTPKHIGRKFANFGIQATTGLPISVGSGGDLRDIKFNYRLVEALGKQAVLSEADHIKPKNDAQDILSLIAEKVSASVVRFVASSKIATR
jgi:hypothetical protein